MDQDRLASFVDGIFEDEIVGRLTEYMRIPNVSPVFDPDWETHGHMERAITLAAEWCRAQPIPGLAVEIVRLPGRTPLLLIDAPGDGDGTVLLYGHLDKQPEMTGWREGLGPFSPVLEDDRLYGRGGADDGYAVFASVAAMRGALEAGGRLPRCVALIECSEESGSPDLPFFVEHLAGRIGDVDLVVCLDSGCGDYDRAWLTSSLRGLVNGTLRADILTEGVHSGDASGIVPESFRILRMLLSRFEDPETGRVFPVAFRVEIPENRVDQAKEAAAVLGGDLHSKFPFTGGARPVVTDPAELVLNETWRAQLAVTGVEGMPSIAKAGNVMRPFTSLKLSLRIPPTLDAETATANLKQLLEADPPYGAKVTFSAEEPANGWNAPDLGEELADRIDSASRRYFGAPAASRGEGGSIPFMAMLGERYPRAKFVVTGVLGPGSNAHGPNEFLHLPTARKLTCLVAELLAAV